MGTVFICHPHEYLPWNQTLPTCTEKIVSGLNYFFWLSERQSNAKKYGFLLRCSSMSLWSSCHCLKYEGSCGRHCILKACACRMDVVWLHTQLPLVRAQIPSWYLYSSGFSIHPLSWSGWSSIGASLPDAWCILPKCLLQFWAPWN